MNEFQIGYHSNNENHLSYTEVTTKKFTNLSGAIIGFNSSYYWFKVEVPPEVSPQNITIQLNETVIESLDVYIDDNMVFTNSGKIMVNPIIKNIALKGNSIYFKVKFRNHAFFDLQLHKSDDFESKQDFSFFSNGWYYGFVFMVFIVNLFFYFSLKNEPFLSYALFVAAINIGISFYDGVLGFLISSEQVESLIPINHLIIGITGFWFATGFLNLNRLYPKAKWVGYTGLATSAILYLWFMISNTYLIIAIADLLVFLLLGYYWIMGIVVIKRQQFALFFVVGYVLVLIAGFIHVVPMNFGMHFLPIPIGLVKIGALFEMLILTYAITFKVKKLQEENLSIKEELKNYVSQLLSFEERLRLEDKGASGNSEAVNKIEQLASEFNLTDREVDVLICIAQQFTNTKIADELFISINTVKYHTRNIYQKLNIKNKSDAISLLSE